MTQAELCPVTGPWLNGETRCAGSWNSNGCLLRRRGRLERADAPDGDGWAGRVTNAALGGFASLAYAGDPQLADYSVEAWVYVDAVGDQHAPLQGLAIRVDPVERRFYRLAAQFGAEAQLTLAALGRDVSDYPIYVRTWTASQIPGAIPARGGWHRIGVRAVGDQFWFSWDGQDLPGGPLRDPRIARGLLGVYATYTSGVQVAQILMDAIVIARSGEPASERR